MKKERDNRIVGEADTPHSALRIPHSSVAWCGWALPVPEEWRPLKIEGSWAKGSLMLGTEGEPVVLVKWWRPEEKRFDAEQWMARRCKALGALPDEHAPTPVGFCPALWVVNLQRREGEGKTVWYGYAPEAGLLIECISTSEVDQALRDRFFGDLLPRLTATPLTEPVTWSLFSTAFTSPPGYTLTGHRIALGDIALELHDADGRRLILRQVFPAKLAMQRRQMEQWLDSPPFMERRKLRRPERADRDDTSLHQRGWKRLPSPMGWFKPRYCTRMARVANDRLYLAESQSQHAVETNLCAEAIGTMTTSPGMTA
jgi:hypothetical protein